MTVTSAPAARSGELDDRGVARGAAVLMVAKPFAGLLFAAGLVILPRWAPAAVVAPVTWCSFTYLFLTSVLNLGLERVVGPWAGRHPQTSIRELMAPILSVRLLTAPAGALLAWGLLALVRVHVTAPLFWWTVVWIAGGLVGSEVYAALRVEGRTALEAAVSICLRGLQAAALIPVATGAWSPTRLVATAALLEVLAAVLLLKVAGLRPSWRAADLRALPWRLLMQFTVLELLAFLYLRVDVLLVGRVLGSADGATYTLLYRVIDAIAALITPMLLMLYPQAAMRAERGGSLASLRRAGSQVVPMAFGLFAVAGTLTVGLVIGLVPRYAGHAMVLRLLFAAVPLMVWSAVELHLRVAEGRTPEVLRVGVITLVVATVTTLPALHWWGLPGAAVGVLAAEGAQLSLLAARGPRDGAGWAATVGAALLLLAWLSTATGLWGWAALVLAGVVVGRLRHLQADGGLW